MNAARHPILVVNGSDDIVIATVNSYILQQHPPNAQLILYPDSGHGAQFQHHELFIKQLQILLNIDTDRDAEMVETETRQSD